MSLTAGHRRLSRAAARCWDAAARYRDARTSLRTPASARSRRGLDWLNFFIADVQTGFGTFVAFYLAGLGWSQQQVGLALAVGGLAGVVAQIPGGALTDVVRWKRGLAAVGIATIGGAALILALAPSFTGVMFAEILQGATAGIILPSIAAISLGLVGRQAMSRRAGRNYRYAAAGNALTAGMMGVTGAYFAHGGIFLVSAVLCIPALIALASIRGDEIDYARARNAATGDKAGNVGRVFDLARNHRLVLFAAAIVLFQLADASILPLIGEDLATRGEQASLWMSALIIVPQVVVAIFAPWVGYHSEAKGRKPLLLLGFAVEPIRAVLLVVSTDYAFLLAAQILNGISAGIVGVMTVLVITDLTTGTGRFNLAIGTMGTLSGAAAAVSTIATGFIVQKFGAAFGFVAISAIAAAATALLWIFLAETKPERYLD